LNPNRNRNPNPNPNPNFTEVREEDHVTFLNWVEKFECKRDLKSLD
jgi:hypothetical protein